MPPPPPRKEGGGQKKGSGALREGQYNEYNPFFFLGPDFYIWFKYVAKKRIFEYFILEIAKIG
jgi:hypothetical protein